jgi:hypothetical protein
MIDLMQFPSTHVLIEDYSLMMMGYEVMAVEIFVDSMAVMKMKNFPSLKWRQRSDPKTLVFNGDDALVHVKLRAFGKRANDQETTSESGVYLVLQIVLVIMIAIWNQSGWELWSYIFKVIMSKNYTILLFVIAVISDRRDTDNTYLQAKGCARSIISM